jgi:hypothetical protein
MRLVFEHLLLPGVFIQEPTMLVSIFHKDKELGVFGYDVCSETELGTGILCRACELMRCSMVNPVLNQCQGIVKTNCEDSVEQAVFIYDGDYYTFKQSL